MRVSYDQRGTNYFPQWRCRFEFNSTVFRNSPRQACVCVRAHRIQVTRGGNPRAFSLSFSFFNSRNAADLVRFAIRARENWHSFPASATVKGERATDKKRKGKDVAERRAKGGQSRERGKGMGRAMAERWVESIVNADPSVLSNSVEEETARDCEDFLGGSPVRAATSS